METKKSLIITILLFVLFAIFTVAIMVVDVKPIGPQNSEVGFATFNQLVHETIGEHIFFYKATEYLGYVALLVAAGFAILGLVQLISRKSLLKVDKDIIWLGVYFILVIVLKVVFDKIALNYRPVILEEGLEASFPSSHTLMAVGILGAAFSQFHRRIVSEKWRVILEVLTIVLMNAIVIGRLISGVHWFTDIVGAIILGAALIMLYNTVEKRLTD